ncbi:acyl-CoA dehydrogenase family protein [Novosphingobium cyanobacteriorum]|uniref:Acyl-CoA dehydrogenase family protein n=1 Tax=Novosphingobium cyanobacteriorum TaxID=3024215 RepID=A0ABT6CE38_9SPHN|nr:acyl-CoA dehydrogenase family protein [Novosphingobium cyanobacteriorum]MDF8332184.1 acyl-CoA dehydrogenase family protein [Novosphingobium cyanobacteriorum]
MNFNLSEEQVMLQDAIRRFLRENYSFEQRRTLIQDAASHPAIWQAIVDLGILGAAIPEALGGLGGGAVETMVIAEAMGEALVTEPYLETAVIGGGLLKRLDGRAADLLEQLVTGAARFALATGEPTSRNSLNHVATTARRDGDDWVLDGAKSVVEGAPGATHLLITARTAGSIQDHDGISLFVVERGHPAIVEHAYRLIDDRGAADIEIKGLRLKSDALLGGEGTALPLLEQVRDEAIAALCADAVGAMRRMLQDTIAYTKQRRQFGQALASFQVLQHRMVDMYMAIERAVSAVYLVTLKLDSPPRERAMAASAAKATIAETARFVGQNAVQLHGGMGMTDELAVGHYFKRATAIESRFGSRDFHLRRYAELSLAPAG